jgi:hypothetical protein
MLAELIGCAILGAIVGAFCAVALHGTISAIVPWQGKDGEE